MTIPSRAYSSTPSSTSRSVFPFTSNKTISLSGAHELPFFPRLGPCLPTRRSARFADAAQPCISLTLTESIVQVQHIIVCGHYDCSGIKASLDKVDLASPLEEWVCNIRDVYRLHKLELDGIRDPERRRRRLVELNTREQAVNVHKAAVVQRRRLYTHMKEGHALPKVRSRR